MMASERREARTPASYSEDLRERTNPCLPNSLSENQRVRETGILIYRIEGGKVEEIWSEMSDLQVVMQLGAFSVPER
jgi:hypothetical protein